MKKQNIRYGRTICGLLMALMLTCVSFAPTVQANDCHDSAIVGLWRVTYYEGTTKLFTTFDQWHSDGLEFEINSVAPGAVCCGTFKDMGHDTVKLFHVIWNFDASGVLIGHIEETQNNVVNHQGTAYEGTFVNKIYDLNGHFVGQESGTLHATRLTVN